MGDNHTWNSSLNQIEIYMYYSYLHTPDTYHLLERPESKASVIARIILERKRKLPFK